MKKRILSLLLALVMVLGLVPWDTLRVESAGLGKVVYTTEDPVTIPDPGSSLGHDMGSWAIVASPTCTVDDKEQGTCTRCDHNETRSIDALGHNFADWEYNDANKLMRTCITCGLVEMWEVDRLFTVGGERSNPDIPMAELRELYDLVDWNMSASYVTQPSTSAPYSAGRLTDDCLNNLVAQVNFFRTIARLDDVGWRESYVTLAQHATVVNAANGHLTHYPNQPADMGNDFYDLGYRGASSSNLALGYSLMRSVLGYLDDSDSSNIDRVGHRRWVLNPYMADTGFGYTGGFSAMYAHNQANRNVDFDYVAFPGGSSIFPNEFFDANCAWSTHLSWDTFEMPSLDDLRVTMTRESDGMEWIFDANTSGTGNYYFNLDTEGYGSGMAIIFRPNGVTSYQGKYTVRITGLWTTDGESAAIEYTVDFQSIESQASVENPFSDVPTGSWYEAPVLWALENGITSGTSDTTFSPGNQCLRAHVVTFLWNAEETPEPAATSSNFSDVPAGAWYEKPVLWAVENGITSGISPTKFGAGDVCSRYQVVYFLWKAAGAPEPKTTVNPFTDVNPGHFFYKAVLWAVENGITSGTSDTTFSPTQPCNRAQVVTFLYKAYT